MSFLLQTSLIITANWQNTWCPTQSASNFFLNNNRIQRRNSRFFTISSLHRELSRTRTFKWPGCNRVQITCNTSSAYRVQHVVLRVTWYEGTAQLFSWQSLNRIHLSFILLAEPLSPWRRGGDRSTRRKPLATSFRKCHMLKPEDSSLKRDSNPHNSTGGSLTATPRVTPTWSYSPVLTVARGRYHGGQPSFHHRHSTNPV